MLGWGILTRQMWHALQIRPFHMQMPEMGIQLGMCIYFVYLLNTIEQPSRRNLQLIQLRLSSHRLYILFGLQTYVPDLPFRIT